MATILVVDDEPDIRTVMSMLLPLDGHVVVTAADGLDALEIVATTPVDLVLTDWRMPRMGGLELCRRLRSDGEACAIPILVSSAAMAEPPGRGDLYDAFLPKPAAYADQMQAIDRLLRERRSPLPRCQQDASTCRRMPTTPVHDGWLSPTVTKHREPGAADADQSTSGRQAPPADGNDKELP